VGDGELLSAYLGKVETHNEEDNCSNDDEHKIVLPVVGKISDACM
jgi:hypothetical protein